MVGSRMMKTVSVLWILFAIVNLLIVGVELVSLIRTSMYVSAFLLPVILGVLWSAAQIAAGFIGCKNWKRPEKAKMCLVAAAVVVVFCLAYNIYMMMNGSTLWPLIGMLAGVAVAAVYMLGAVYNNKLNA